jgi:S1-C subfamily serine protease
MNKVVDDIKQYGNVQRAMIGIKGSDVNLYVDTEKEKGNEVDLGTMEGIYVAEVVEDGAAADADLQKGDVITHIDGQKVSKFGELQGIIAQKRPGDKITITYLRDKKKKTATLTLKNEQGNTKVVKNADLDVLGGQFKPITDAQKEQLNIGYGLQVIKVSGGRLKDAGVPQGFVIQRVNDQSVKIIEDLQKIVKEASTSKEPVLYIQGIYPTGKKGYFAVPLQNE